MTTQKMIVVRGASQYAVVVPARSNGSSRETTSQGPYNTHSSAATLRPVWATQWTLILVAL
jgi:hypothetical protein